MRWRPADDAPIGSHLVKQFLDDASLRHHPGRGVMITTSTFTRRASQIGKETRIRRVEGAHLARLLQAGDPRP
jgi:restriction endonuclease Mrr